MLHICIDIHGKTIATIEIEHSEGKRWRWRYIEEGVGGTVLHDRRDGILSLAAAVLSDMDWMKSGGG